jgi:leucyl/phenylalanyl-tRNA---protein transferase
VTIRLPRLADDPAAPFPAAAEALAEPNGLLAWGGDLHPERLLNAYRHGVFPWYSDGEPLLWWSPDPRCIFDAGEFALPRRFRRALRDCDWQVRADTAFDAVVAACARSPRRGQSGTWITREMRQAYGLLHRLGHAHSIEVFARDELIGGLYGVALDRAFCGESMFSARSGASKVALAALCRWLSRAGIGLLDAQVPNPHLLSLGAREIRRDRYLERIHAGAAIEGPAGPWNERFAPLRAFDLA